MKKINDNFVLIISIFLLVIAILSASPLYFTQIPQGNETMVAQINGFIWGTGFAGVVLYWIGSSKGSKDKDSIIKNGNTA